MAAPTARPGHHETSAKESRTAKDAKSAKNGGGTRGRANITRTPWHNTAGRPRGTNSIVPNGPALLDFRLIQKAESLFLFDEMSVESAKDIGNQLEGAGVEARIVRLPLLE